MRKSIAHQVSPEALQLHNDTIVIDLHADTAAMMKFGYDIFQIHRPPLPMAAFGYHLDIPRMQAGGLTAQFFGLVTFPLTKVGLFESALEQMSLVKQCAAKRPETIRAVTEANEIKSAKRAGQTAALFGLEGAHALEGKLENLENLAREGLRYFGLTHFTKNQAASPAMGPGASKVRGLTGFGRNLVQKCNELGVLVDLAHANRKSFMEAVDLSADPIIVSHTGLAGVRKLWRNIDDEQVRAIAETGGCIGIIFSRYYLGGPSISRLADHIIHCVNIGGEDCPALGSDFDGLIVPPRELPDVSALPRITHELLERRVPERIIRKILGENVLRVLSLVPARARLKHTQLRDSSTIL